MKPQIVNNYNASRVPDNLLFEMLVLLATGQEYYVDFAYWFVYNVKTLLGCEPRKPT